MYVFTNEELDNFYRLMFWKYGIHAVGGSIADGELWMLFDNESKGLTMPTHQKNEIYNFMKKRYDFQMFVLNGQVVTA